MDKKINAKARVQITVEESVSSWGEDCAIGQLYKQAAESARDALLAMLKPDEQGRLVIVGEPKILGVITEVEK
jgi:hypothetical protein